MHNIAHRGHLEDEQAFNPIQVDRVLHGIARFDRRGISPAQHACQISELPPLSALLRRSPIRRGDCLRLLPNLAVFAYLVGHARLRSFA